jgi:hypothetical protein
MAARIFIAELLVLYFNLARTNFIIGLEIDLNTTLYTL